MEDPTTTTTTTRSKSVQDVRSRLRETQQKKKEFYKSSSHSIPSRFETKLNTSSMEKKGFGTSSSRFQVFVVCACRVEFRNFELNEYKINEE